MDEKCTIKIGRTLEELRNKDENGGKLDPHILSEEEENTFNAIESLLTKGAKFLGNYWINRQGNQNGRYEIKLKLPCVEGQVSYFLDIPFYRSPNPSSSD